MRLLILNLKLLVKMFLFCTGRRGYHYQGRHSVVEGQGRREGHRETRRTDQGPNRELHVRVREGKDARKNGQTCVRSCHPEGNKTFLF